MRNALEKIEAALSGARRPAVLWSGGKDSTVLLEMARRVRPGIECILWRVPGLPIKWTFANRLAVEWNLTVFDFPPKWSALRYGLNGKLDLVEAYELGADCMVVGRGTESERENPAVADFEAGKWMCGLDWLARPKAAGVQFPWDILLHGHKSSDVDPCNGAVPLSCDVMRLPGMPEVHYPLREWTDADVANYTLANGIPWDGGRYRLDGSDLVPRTDLELNPDYYQTCLRCIDRREDKFVRCPKRGGAEINNVSDHVQVWEPEMAYCGLGAEN